MLGSACDVEPLSIAMSSSCTCRNSGDQHRLGRWFGGHCCAPSAAPSACMAWPPSSCSLHSIPAGTRDSSNRTEQVYQCHGQACACAPADAGVLTHPDSAGPPAPVPRAQPPCWPAWHPVQDLTGTRLYCAESNDRSSCCCARAPKCLVAGLHFVLVSGGPPL